MIASSTARWRFTVADFARMLETGILSESDRVELIDGEVHPMTPIGPGHASIVMRMNDVLTRHFRNRALVNVQNPIRLSDVSAPQPDFTILRPRPDFYAQ